MESHAKKQAKQKKNSEMDLCLSKLGVGRKGEGGEREKGGKIRESLKARHTRALTNNPKRREREREREKRAPNRLSHGVSDQARRQTDDGPCFFLVTNLLNGQRGKGKEDRETR